MSRVVMLCPVGTSVLSNTKDAAKSSINRNGKVGEALSRLQPPFEALRTREDLPPDAPEQVIRDFLKNDLKEGEFWSNLRNGQCPSLEKQRFPTAELQSVVRWLDEKKDSECKLSVKLAPSQGAEDPKGNTSFLTALVTKVWLEELAAQQCFPRGQEVDVEIDPVPLGVDTRGDFYSGVDDLFKWYNQRCDKNRDPEVEIVINATGGFKSMSAFSVLYAQIHDLPCIYTYESGGIIELLPLPLTYALDALDEEMTLLRGIVDAPDSFSNVSPKDLPRWLQGLCRPDEEGGVRPLELAKTLVDYYKKNRHRTGGIGRGLLKRLTPSTRSYFEARIAKEWSELWMGDQIPETVEHSRRHSKRLMELGENLFRAAEPELRSLARDGDGALALLMACIYLHDIGHTAVAFPVDAAGDAPAFPLAMFPSSVREVHHLLSRDLITLRKEALFPSEGDSETLVPMLRTLVPLVCSYHRGYTTLCCNLAEPSGAVRSVGELLYGFGDFGKTLVPLASRLETRQKELEEWGLSSDTVLRVAALLRVLDGCDVQADRAVGDTYMRARLERTWDEGHALWRQIQPLLAHLPAGTWETLAGMYELVASREDTVAMAVKGQLGPGMQKALGEKAKKIYELVFNDLLALRQKFLAFSWDRMWQDPAHLMACSLANRLAFKWEQFLHFYKHRCVGFVLPVRRGDRGTIGLWPNPDMGGMESMLEDVRKDIEKEIGGTQGLLEGLDLRVEVISSKGAISLGTGTGAAEEGGSRKGA